MEARLGYGDTAFPRYRQIRDLLLTIAWDSEMAVGP